MLRIFTAPHPVPLLLELSAALGPAAAGDPLAPDLIVCERGTDRWLWQFLAETHGIAANLQFEPPAGFLWRMLRLFVPEVPADARFDRAPLAWRIVRLLPGLLSHAAFAPLKRYLDRPDERKLHQLAERIAGVYNDYMIYRPTMLLGWEAGQRSTRHADEVWQMALWQALVAETGSLHRAGLLQTFLARSSTLPRPADLPARASIFGIPALPPVYVDALVALGAHMDIDLLVFNPSEEFWGDLVDPKRMTYLADGAPDGADLPHRLLALWGQPVRQFLSALYDHAAEHHELTAPAPGTDTLLHRLQSDLRALRTTPATLAADDDSLRVISAYGPLREVEILHDYLLDRFQRDPSLEARDVRVMVPDLERYAPAIEAVFGAAEGLRLIPWSLTDRAPRAQPLLATLMQLLQLPDSRFPASDVLGLLETPAVARRFGLAADSLNALREALRRARLHGDLDGEHRARRGLPADDIHSWRFALRRLFLGIAMSPQTLPVLGVLPEPAFEGQRAAALGQLQSLLDVLAGWQARLTPPRTPVAWVETLHALVDALFAPDDEEEAVLNEALSAARAFLEDTRAAAFDSALSPTIFREELLNRLAAPAARGNLRTGRVVFSGMYPMRSLPCRIIALLGMNAEAYPREQRPAGFDLIARSPAPGDRSRRLDDRHLFLETLLCARDALYVSYTGRRPQDDSPCEPSVLLHELLDQVVLTHGGEPARASLLAQLVHHHPLQAFSRRYFENNADTGAPLFTYGEAWLAPARAAAGGARGRLPFCESALPPPAEPLTAITLPRLLRFFHNPAASFLLERFGIGLFEADESLDDDEPFALNRLDSHRLRTQALLERLAGVPAEALTAKFKASGDLPQAAFGELAWAEVAQETEALFNEISPHLAGARDLDIDLSITTLHGPRGLTGRLRNLTPGQGQVLFRAGRERAEDLLSAWICHLALLVAAPSGIPAQTTLFFRDGKKGVAVGARQFSAVPAPETLLARLLEHFADGLCLPLPLLPPCALAYVKQQRKEEAKKQTPKSKSARAPSANDEREQTMDEDQAAEQRALDAAKKEWSPPEFTRDSIPGHGDNAAVRIVFGTEPPLDARFTALASEIFGPALAASSEPDNTDDDA